MFRSFPMGVYYFHLYKGRFIVSPTVEKYDTGVRRRNRRHYANFSTGMVLHYLRYDCNAMKIR